MKDTKLHIEFKDRHTEDTLLSFDWTHAVDPISLYKEGTILGLEEITDREDISWEPLGDVVVKVVGSRIKTTFEISHTRGQAGHDRISRTNIVFLTEYHNE